MILGVWFPKWSNTGMAILISLFFSSCEERNLYDSLYHHVKTLGQISTQTQALNIGCSNHKRRRLINLSFDMHGNIQSRYIFLVQAMV